MSQFRLYLYFALVAILGPLGLAASATAQTTSTTATSSLDIPRVTSAPRLEDYLSEGSTPGLAVTDFRQRSPHDLEPATEQTTAYLSYDAANLYVAFVCKTADPAQLRARMARREAVFSDDLVGIYLDTFFDRQRSYVFLATPLGIQADGIHDEGAGDDYSFDTQWSAKGRVTETGYVVWMSIPFRSLRFPTGAASQKWGVALTRQVPAKSEEDFWPSITERINGLAPQFGTLTGIAGVSPGRNIQFTPYGTFNGARVVNAIAPGYAKQADGRAGADAKLVYKDAFTFDVTAKPDFSQVESDQPQVTANQRFEVFFPELRPFFLENADFFNTPWTLFFSRRIRDPQLGVRSTGKIGQLAFGGMLMDDSAPGQLADSGTPGADAGTTAAVLRGRYDFANQSRIGVLGTIRRFGPSSNDVFGVDTRLRFNDHWVSTAQIARSAAASLDGTSSTGVVMYEDISRGGRKLNYTLSHSAVSPDFRAQLGFVPRVDVHQVTSFLSYRWRPKSGPLVDFGPNSFVQGTWTYGGVLEDWIVRFPFNVDLKARTNIFGRHAIISEKVAGLDFRQREDLVTFSSQYLGWMGVGVSYAHGTRPNYSPAGDLSPFLGAFTDSSLSLTFRPTSALLVDETYLYSLLDTRDNSPGTGKIFSNHIVRSRVNYQFTREWSLRAIVDYNTLTPNASLVALDRSRHVVSDLLLTWLLHPGTALYIGYTDGYDNFRLDPLSGLVPTTQHLSSSTRQLFIKTSWMFRT